MLASYLDEENVENLSIFGAFVQAAVQTAAKLK